MTDDFFRSCLDQMIDHRHPLAVLVSRLPWETMQAGIAPQFVHKERPLQQIEQAPDLTARWSARGAAKRASPMSSASR